MGMCVDVRADMCVPSAFFAPPLVVRIAACTQKRPVRFFIFQRTCQRTCQHACQLTLRQGCCYSGQCMCAHHFGWSFVPVNFTCRWKPLNPAIAACRHTCRHTCRYTCCHACCHAICHTCCPTCRHTCRHTCHQTCKHKRRRSCRGTTGQHTAQYSHCRGTITYSHCRWPRAMVHRGYAYELHVGAQAYLYTSLQIHMPAYGTYPYLFLVGMWK